jgi:CRP-like cAMP-binding protein
VQRDEGREFVVTTMGRGQFFGEIELLHGGRAIATVRAGLEGGVEVAALNKDEFQALLAESAPLREAIDRVAHEREAEHAAAEGSRAARGGDARG